MFMDCLHRYARTTPWLYIYIALAHHLGLSSFDLVIHLVPLISLSSIHPLPRAVPVERHVLLVVRPCLSLRLLAYSYLGVTPTPYIIKALCLDTDGFIHNPIFG
jgi:hypothetical protein